MRYGVLQRYFDNGKVYIKYIEDNNIIPYKKSNNDYDEYLDIFNTPIEALKFFNEVKRA